MITNNDRPICNWFFTLRNGEQSVTFVAFRQIRGNVEILIITRLQGLLDGDVAAGITLLAHHFYHQRMGGGRCGRRGGGMSGRRGYSWSRGRAGCKGGRGG